MIDAEKMMRVAAQHQVELDAEQASGLADLVREVEEAYSREITDKSIDDFVGPFGAGRFERSVVQSRSVLISCLAVARGAFAAPAHTGDLDPMPVGVLRYLRLPAADTGDYATVVGDAARRVALAVGAALASMDPQDIAILANAAMMKSAAHRPASGLDLPRRLIRAAYFWCHHANFGTTFATGDPARGKPPSRLVRLTLAVCDALGMPVDEGTIRAEVYEYRRNVLRIPSAMRGVYDDVEPAKEHFVQPPLSVDDLLAGSAN